MDRIRHERLTVRLHEHIKAIRRYHMYGVPPGAFIEAVLSNDLIGTFAHADEQSRAELHELLKYIYRELPLGIWGSRKRVWDHIINTRALEEQRKAQQQ